jgi:sulfite reductase (ferredoxin)
MRFLLGHPDCQDFGRKFKIAFSGCAESACGLANMHDMGLIAVRKQADDGTEQRGFAVYVGGGLGTVPYQAKLFDPFVPEEEILPLAQAISRVFARLGEKKNRARARIKFLVAKLGIDKFRHLVLEERRILPLDPRWTAYLEDLPHYAEQPLKPAESPNGGPRPEGFDAWLATNVYRQRQPGYVVATVSCPLGDVTSIQMRQLADIARKYVGDAVRTTVEQNIVLRWVSEADLPALYGELRAIGLGGAGAGTILDVVSCPGTDTCKLGIASSRGLARELSLRLAVKQSELDEAVKGLRIKVSGCFNSCGQHHVADLGFYGVSRKVGGATVPHFQVVLGGKWEENAGAYGLAIGAVPSKRIPDVVSRITERYVAEREKGESFQGFIRRLGKVALKDLLEELAKVPAYDEDRSYYSDWGDPREFTVGDMGKGECAGEVVSQIEFDMAAAERLVFEASVWLDKSEYEKADDLAYRAMLEAARGLVKLEFWDVPADPDRVIEEFRRRFYDTELFFDRFAGGKFAQYLFRRHDRLEREYGDEVTRRLVEEAQLFLEAAHACHGRILEQASRAPAIVPVAAAAAPAAD